MADKAEGAFLTIGELADELGLPQHILRYWESRFPQLRPLQRAGKRRYYRPDDVALVRRINQLLNHEGYTIKGVQKLLSARAPDQFDAAPVVPAERTPTPVTPITATPMTPEILAELTHMRASLARALAAA
ncbi:MerR family transcriptional regulator [Sphingomonas sp. LaA6.9]|uniref:MerR family transcriptional regulator n=1 Tax=Sphingomonas sp. LaA6.9 TaxID=2919914 RepID=UPI001F4FE758|nr:MerR family transcriptional regulator [Sphingomonas sp. LaA6.9]MCJ8158625.1 MerR family transcriptional regulator [Sphingomonas sp. LaA6.9]